jgi:hypothetical protein
MDLAGAYWREGNLDGAESHARRAMELGYPLPGLALNYLACIAARRGDTVAMNERFAEAMQRDPQHWVLTRNLRAVRAGDLTDLVARHDFQLLERVAQPTLPGALGDDFAVWGPPTPAPARPVGGVRAADARKLPLVGA